MLFNSVGWYKLLITDSCPRRGNEEEFISGKATLVFDFQLFLFETRQKKRSYWGGFLDGALHNVLLQKQKLDAAGSTILWLNVLFHKVESLDLYTMESRSEV